MKFFIFFSLLITATTGFAQDLVYLKSGPDPVSVTVVEVNSKEVKYKIAPDNALILYFPKEDVKRIEFANGMVLNFGLVEDLDVNKRVGSVKASFLAPVFGHTNLSYEGYINNSRSWEVTIGAIGLGKKRLGGEASGGYVKAGYKWIFKEETDPVMKPKQLLQGFYLKPEVTLGKYDIRGYADEVKRIGYQGYTPIYSYIPVEDKNIGFLSMIVNLGYQVVFADGFTLDASVGLGYYGAIEDGGPKGSREEYYYSFTTLDTDNKFMAFTGGIRVGYTFCQEKRFQMAQ
jgi:hypothetical protein